MSFYLIFLLIIVFISLIGLLSLFIMTNQKDGRSIAKELAKIRQEFEQGRYNSAISMAKKALEKHGSEPCIELILARSYHLLGLKNNAYSILEGLVSKNSIPPAPDRDIFYRFLASCLEENGNHSKAVSCYRVLLNDEPHCAEHNYNLGRLLMSLGTSGEAIQYLKRALEINPRMFNAAELLGNIAFDRGDTEQAEIYFKQVLDARPTPKISLKMGKMLNSLGRHREALNYLKKDRYEDSQIYLAKLEIAKAYRCLKNYAQAIQEYNKILQRYKINLSGMQKRYVCYWRAVCYEKNGDLERALDKWQQLYRNDPLYKDVKKRLQHCEEASKKRRLEEFSDMKGKDFKANIRKLLAAIGVEMLSIKSDTKETVVLGESTRGRKMVAIFYPFQTTVKLCDVRRFYERSRLQGLTDIALFAFGSTEDNLLDFVRSKAIIFYDSDEIDTLLQKISEAP